MWLDVAKVYLDGIVAGFNYNPKVGDTGGVFLGSDFGFSYRSAYS